MMNTTLNEIRKYGPCGMRPEDGEIHGWLKLLAYLGKKKSDDEPLSFKTILDSNGIEDAVWCLRTLPIKEQMHFRADVAELALTDPYAAYTTGSTYATAYTVYATDRDLWPEIEALFIKHFCGEEL